MEIIQRSKWSESMADWRWKNKRESKLIKGQKLGFRVAFLVQE